MALVNFETLIIFGTRAAQPAAATTNRGTLYYVTDEQVTERVADDNSTWQEYSPDPDDILADALAAALAAIAATKLDDLAAPDDNTDLNASTTKHGLLRKLDNSAVHFLDGQGNWSTPDHGSLGGLSDDDHTQYILVAGTRAFSGDQSMGSHKLTNVTDPGSAQDAATKAYVDAQVSGGAAITQLTGDVTAGPGSGSQAATIANDAVTNAKLANMAASTIKARKTASTGDPEDCTLSEVLDFISSAAQGDLLYRGAATWARLGAGTAGQVLKTFGAAANPAWVTRKAVFGITIGDGTNVITTGWKGRTSIPVAGTITSWRILSCDAATPTSGSIVIDIWKDTFAHFPEDATDTITASAKPTLTTATNAESSTLTGWTTSVAAGDVVSFNVDSVTSVKKIRLEVTMEVTG